MEEKLNIDNPHECSKRNAKSSQNSLKQLILPVRTEDKRGV